jgi:hypothetical protein
MTFDLYLAAFAVERLQTTDLPAAAMQAVEEGNDSPAIAALAGTLPSERSPFEIEEMWTRALRDLCKAVPARIEAGHRLKRYFAGLVSSGIAIECAPRVVLCCWCQATSTKGERCRYCRDSSTHSSRP